MAERVMGYLDGFNFYFGLRTRGWDRFLWLDPVLLLKNLLRDGQVLVGVKYFTARLSGPGSKWLQQKVFLEAIEGGDRCSLHFGQYQDELRRCSKCGFECLVPNEKMTDVNIATEILVDGFQNTFDEAILVSGDGDLAPALLKLRGIPGKRIIVAFPPRRSSRLLQQAAHAYFTIGRRKLAASQMPDHVIKPNGIILERPQDWR